MDRKTQTDTAQCYNINCLCMCIKIVPSVATLQPAIVIYQSNVINWMIDCSICIYVGKSAHTMRIPYFVISKNDLSISPPPKKNKKKKPALILPWISNISSRSRNMISSETWSHIHSKQNSAPKTFCLLEYIYFTFLKKKKVKCSL